MSRAVSPVDSLPSLADNSPASSSASSVLDLPVSHSVNQHLAVLLPKHLWKQDSSSTVCDNFYCRYPFSLFERKHHCRKCGGIFCHACTSRSTPLLDTSNLDFLLPPRNVPISTFVSPISPLVDARVCDDCWDLIHGCPSTPHTPDASKPRPSFKSALSIPISLLKIPLSPVSPTSPISQSPASHSPDGLIPPSLSRKLHPLRAVPSNSSLNTQSSSESAPLRRSQRSTLLRTSHLTLPQDLERSYGELDAYPLRRASVICKATGGGRWEPKQYPVLVGSRQPVPGGKAPYEIEIEREERQEQLRRQNPVVKDGDFQYRFVKNPEPEPITLSRFPFNFSTF